MKKLLPLIFVFVSINALSLEKISLECSGSGEEIFATKTQIIQNTKFDNLVRRYELSENGFTEYISTLTLEHTRKDIEKKGDEKLHHDGYYRFEKSIIAYSENEDSDNYEVFSKRYFQINRKTTAWSSVESYKGGLIAIYGEDVTKTLRINGNCNAWDSKEKF